MPSSPVASLWPSLTQPPYSKYLSYNEDIKMEHKQVGRRAVNSCFKSHNQTMRIVLIVSASFVCGVVVTYCALKWITCQQGKGHSSVATANRDSDQVSVTVSVILSAMFPCVIRYGCLSFNIR